MCCKCVITDQRESAVQIKRVAEVGMPHESSVVPGIVCRKNIALKQMRTRIVRPRILLLGSPIEFHRVAGRLTAFDHVTPDQACLS